MVSASFPFSAVIISVNVQSMLTNDDYPQFILLCSHLRNELTYLRPVIAMDVECRDSRVSDGAPVFFFIGGCFYSGQACN